MTYTIKLNIKFSILNKRPIIRTVNKVPKALVSSTVDNLLELADMYRESAPCGYTLSIKPTDK